MSTRRGKKWWVLGAVAAVAASAFVWVSWSQHQQLAVAMASVPANMELEGATRSHEMKEYQPFGASADAPPPLLGVIYTLTDRQTALADAEAQLAADGWTLANETGGASGELQYVKDGSGIKGVVVSVDGNSLTVAITPDE